MPFPPMDLICVECRQLLVQDNVITCCDYTSQEDVDLHQTLLREVECRCRRPVANVKMSASACHFCALISELVDNLTATQKIAHITHSIERNPWNRKFVVHLKFIGQQGNELASDVVDIYDNPDMRSEDEADVFPNREEFNQLRHSKDASPPRSSTDQIYGFIRSCLDYCRENHPKCNEDVDTTWLPSRLISLGSANAPVEPRLVSTRDLCSSGPIWYLALSHRWGTTRFLTLNSGNAQDFWKHIPVAALRRTFQDTIKVARELGIRYVWIDSLCIIQDSEEDWRSESKTMHLVYRNAVCTLAAAEAEKLEEGLIDIAKPAVKTAFLLSLDLLGKAEEFMIRYDPVKFYHGRLAKWPLVKRGWVLQESLLSRRTVYFGSPLIWECRESLHSSEQACHIGYQYPLVPQKKIWPSLLGGVEDTHKHWRRAVSRFSRCALTKSDDKLVAMSGIARTIEPMMHSEYLAGLWRQFISEDLLWAVGVLGEPTDGPPTAPTRRPASYRAPSWSWASIDGPIDYKTPVVSDQYSVLSSVLPYVKARGGDTFGQIEDAHLVVMAKTFDLGPYQSLWHNLWVAASERPNPRWFVPDEDISGEARLRLLPVILSSQGAYCIIMEYDEMRQGMLAYKRVGFARVNLASGALGNSSWVVPDWFQYWGTEDVQRFQLI